MRRLSRIIVLAAALLPLSPMAGARSQAAPDVPQLLNIGATKITCLRSPCPHRGIYRPWGGSLQARKAALLYADTEGHGALPRLIAPAEAVAAVTAAWNDLKCVQVLGHFEKAASDHPTLRIARIVGAC